MNNFEQQYNYRVNLAYAQEDNLLFGERIYKEDAKLWLYKDLAQIVFLAAQTCFKQYGLHYILYDGLRPYEAQQAMMKTKRAQDNPHWMEEPRLLSTPGSGGHPRGMAIDIGLEDVNGALIDMGCPFDFLANSPLPENNPAHREYKHPQAVRKNRDILDKTMINAAEELGIRLSLLPEEWWDFRLPSDFYGQYAPFHDIDLPKPVRMML